MTGQKLKEILSSHGVVFIDMAKEMGVSQPAISQMMRVQDIKSGTLEKICDILGWNMNYFYGGTKYALTIDSNPEIKINQPSFNETQSTDKNYDKLKEENILLRGKYEALQKAYELLLSSRLNSTSKAG